MKISLPTASLKKHLGYGARLDPARDWIILLVLSGVALVGIVAWNVWAFHTVAQGGALGTVKFEPPPVVSQSSLDTIRTILDARAVEEKKYKTGTYLFTSPSQ